MANTCSYVKAAFRVVLSRVGKPLQWCLVVALIAGPTSALADWACKFNASGLPFDEGGKCAAAGGTCVPDYDTVENTCKGASGKAIPMPPAVPKPSAPAASSGGTGTADPIGPPASPFQFSMSSFVPGTFSYAKTLDDGVTVVPLTTLDFNSTLVFSATANPNILTGRFTAFEWIYQPFDLPSGFFQAVNREVLDLAPAVDLMQAVLNLSTGQMSLDIPVIWMTSLGQSVSHNYEHFDIQITPTADPMFVDVQISDYSSFNIVAEPISLVIAMSGLAALCVIGRRSRKRIQLGR